MNQMLQSRFAEEWTVVGRLADIPVQGARVVKSRHGDIAVFRAADDAVFALRNACPHRGGPLSEGIVHGHSVTCPLHNFVISLETGVVEGPDEGCARTIAVRVEDGVISLDLGRLAGVAP
jgi:nitrite reductase [NAD(P)H], small subunit